MKLVLAMFATLFSGQLFANSIDFNQLVPDLRVEAQLSEDGLVNWEVGDYLEYKLDMGVFQGTMKMYVAKIVARGIWLNQDVDLGQMGQQNMEILINPNTGEVIEMIVNGEQQEPPKQGPQEVILQEEVQVTVPAGTFDAIHMKIKNKDDGKVTEAWINPYDLPITGMIKTIAPGQFGDVKIDMTSFGFANR